MIKKILHVADIHIFNDTSAMHMEDKINKLIKSLIMETKKCGKDECRIVVVGDIYQNKIRASNEAKKCFHHFLNYVNKICPTYIVAGNHDMLQNNRGRLDSISTTFSIEKVYPKVTYLDKALDYKSGYIVDDNVIFALYSMFDNFKTPNIDEKLRQENPDKKIVGLYHGDIVGSVTDTGRYSESGIDTDMFKYCDCVMAGHIHKMQEIKKNGVPIVYSGSIFQKELGENVSGHGYVVWNMEDMSHEFVEVDNDYRMYKFTVDSYEDVSNDVERLLNL